MRNDTVTVCFIDPAIQALFTDLLAARGVRTLALREIHELASDTKIITEPYFLPDLPTSVLAKCLVVGKTDDPVSSPAFCLTRPLTEQKIEAALAQLLAL